MKTNDFVKINIEKMKVSNTFLGTLLTEKLRKEFNYVLNHPDEVYSISGISNSGEYYFIVINGISVPFTENELLVVEKEHYFNKHIKEEEHYGSLVKTNINTDRMRRNECMCLYCEKMKPGSPENCPAAQAMYETSVKYDCAMMMTRCKNYIPGKYSDGRKKEN